MISHRPVHSRVNIAIKMSYKKTTAVRVLLVEDEPADEEYAKRALSNDGHSDFELCCARELTEALDYLQSAQFHVLLLDLGLPGCCGLEALQEIRAENGRIPIVVLTGLTDQQVALEAIEQGAQDYLVKGQLTPDTLRRTIRYAIQRQQLLATAIDRDLAARQAEARKSAMLESALDAIISIDHQGNILEFNPAAEKIFGYTRAEMIGQPMSAAIIPPCYREKHQQGVTRYLSTGESRILNQRLELTAIRSDGSQFPIELTITRIPIVGPPTFTAFIRDVSDRRQAQEALDERVRLAVFMARIGVVLTRPDDLQSTLKGCTEALVKDLDAAFARIWTLNPQDDVLELQASAGLYTHVDGPHSRIPVGQFKIGLIAAERKPHLTNKVIGDQRVGDQEWAKREGMVAFAGYPLVVDDRLVGVMAMFARDVLKPATLDAMAAVGDQIAAGIERKRAEKSLQFTQFTIDHVATPVLWSNAEGRFFNVNAAACRLTGYTREELLSLRVSDVNPSIPQASWPAVWNEIRQRGTLTMESDLQRKDGTRVPISVDSNLLQADGTEFSCSFLQDITERKQAEQLYQQNELRFRAVYNQLQLQIERMPLAYILFDADYRVVDWNPAAEKIFGYLKEEVLGMGPPFEKIVPEAFRFKTEEILRSIQLGDMSAHSVNDNLTKDGRTITCEWMNTPLRAEDGQFSGLMCLAQDVTERNRLEEQFRQAQKMEAVGSLAGGIAHEFNNLLQAIRGYTEFAMDGLPPSEQRYQDLDLVLQSADRATVLTRQLLSFGRRQVLQRTHVDPNQVIAGLTKLLRPLIGENIELQTRLAPDLVPVFADAGQLQQMLLNLCINARDAMSEGGRLIIRSQNISLTEGFCMSHPGAKPGPYLVLSVTDTGSGMTSDVKARIFEPFFTTKELGKGTGLGLAMVYGMVKQHGGIINVYTEPNLGTTFKIYLPTAVGLATAPEEGPTKHARGGNETILIAEDESVVRNLAVRILTQAGYSVLVAADGAEAVELFEANANEVSLVLLDAIMPKLNGHQTYDRLKLKNPHLPVVFCSGYDPESGQVKLLVDKGVRMVQKPYDPDVLLLDVREALDARDLLEATPCTA